MPLWHPPQLWAWPPTFAMLYKNHSIFPHLALTVLHVGCLSDAHLSTCHGPLLISLRLASRSAHSQLLTSPVHKRSHGLVRRKYCLDHTWITESTDPGPYALVELQKFGVYFYNSQNTSRAICMGTVSENYWLERCIRNHLLLQDFDTWLQHPEPIGCRTPPQMWLWRIHSTGDATLVNLHNRGTFHFVKELMEKDAFWWGWNFKGISVASSHKCEEFSDLSILCTHLLYISRNCSDRYHGSSWLLGPALSIQRLMSNQRTKEHK